MKKSSYKKEGSMNKMPRKIRRKKQGVYTPVNWVRKIKATGRETMF